MLSIEDKLESSPMEDVEATGSEGSLLGKDDRQASSSGGALAAAPSSGACEESVAAALDSWALWAVVSLLILVDLVVLLRQATASAEAKAWNGTGPSVGTGERPRATGKQASKHTVCF